MLRELDKSGCPDVVEQHARAARPGKKGQPQKGRAEAPHRTERRRTRDARVATQAVQLILLALSLLGVWWLLTTPHGIGLATEFITAGFREVSIRQNPPVVPVGAAKQRLQQATPDKYAAAIMLDSPAANTPGDGFTTFEWKYTERTPDGGSRLKTICLKLDASSTVKALYVK